LNVEGDSVSNEPPLVQLRGLTTVSYTHLDVYKRQEDSSAEVDMNVVMTSSGRFVEVQGTAEGVPFARTELDQLLGLAELGINQILEVQAEVLATPPTDRSAAAKT